MTNFKILNNFSTPNPPSILLLTEYFTSPLTALERDVWDVRKLKKFNKDQKVYDINKIQNTNISQALLEVRIPIRYLSAFSMNESIDRFGILEFLSMNKLPNMDFQNTGNKFAFKEAESVMMYGDRGKISKSFSTKLETPYGYSHNLLNELFRPNGVEYGEISILMKISTFDIVEMAQTINDLILCKCDGYLVDQAVGEKVSSAFLISKNMAKYLLETQSKISTQLDKYSGYNLEQSILSSDLIDQIEGLSKSLRGTDLVLNEIRSRILELHKNQHFLLSEILEVLRTAESHLTRPQIFDEIAKKRQEKGDNNSIRTIREKLAKELSAEDFNKINEQNQQIILYNARCHFN